MSYLFVIYFILLTFIIKFLFTFAPILNPYNFRLDLKTNFVNL